MSEETPGESFWARLRATATGHGPAMTVCAILLVAQPVIQTTIEVVQELIAVKQDLDPSTRPVTKAELDIVNQKIDYNNQLILAAIARQQSRSNAAKVDIPLIAADSKDYKALDDKLSGAETKADVAFKRKGTKK